MLETTEYFIEHGREHRRLSSPGRRGEVIFVSLFVCLFVCLTDCPLVFLFINASVVIIPLLFRYGANHSSGSRKEPLLAVMCGNGYDRAAQAFLEAASAVEIAVHGQGLREGKVGSFDCSFIH